MSGGPVTRGLDGLTNDQLRRSREAWWDEQFTALLLQAIPEKAHKIVDVGCGLARAAHELLPHRPDLAYIGIDLDAARLAEAREELSSRPYGARTTLIEGNGEHLPKETLQCDALLAAMTLQHVQKPGELLREGHRALKPGGVVVVVEPDNLGQRFYFDGLLDEVTESFAALSRQWRLARLPADIAVGPKVPALLREAEYGDVSMRVHLAARIRWESRASYGTRLLRILNAMAKGGTFGPEDPLVVACRDAVHRWLADAKGSDEAFGASVVPLFMSTGRKSG